MLRLFFRFMTFFSFVIVVGCYNSDQNIESEELKSNLIESYMDESVNKQNSIEERKNSLEKAYSICSTLNNSTFKIEKIQNISFTYYSLKDYENYKRMNEKALKLSTEINDSLNIARSYAYLGIYYRPSKLDIAYENFYEAEKIYASLSGNISRKEIAFDHGKVLVDLAQILRKTKDYGKSESITIKAIESFEEAENDLYIPMCYTNLGNLANSLEHYDEAIEYHLKAIEYAKGTDKEIPQTLTSFNNIGIVYKSQQKYDKAKEYYHKALSYTEFLSKRPRRHARLLDNLAYVNFLSKDEADIPDLFYMALKIRDSINDQNGIATNTLHLAEYYKSIAKDSIARVYAERSRDLSIKIQNNGDLLKVYRLLSDISDSKEGLSYANKYIVLNDSLIKEERLFRDKFARIRFETKEIAKENQQISRENQILIIAILGLTALFLLGYIIFRQQQSNKELLFAQTQQESNEEIYRLLLNQQIKLEEGRQMEQQRMSEELHDGVLGRLFGVRLSLDGINQRANDGFTEARNKYIDELKAIEKEIRLISHDLGAETLPSDVAYIDAVENLIKDLCEVHKIEFEFNNDEDIDWEGIDDQKKVNFFRILQESMQNIFKHAHADHIKINFDYVDSTINLTILDDGIGFKANKVKKGIGLKNITSRVSQMNGEVQFLSNEGSGTKVSVHVPIEAKVEEVY
ncbi:tetratricopeptide repeat-containing sensor histidine kinase [Aquimarina megaterium]|uniref:tetratricopeptide repeat-containing sensor histidine kinase n=1 Tax=Aquimarina megaterium TaxID=1443666 RepID=UPI0009DE14AE|nr:sensor histidine kinase [Aquimarina megaterium]